jgi:hypothetical protein
VCIYKLIVFLSKEFHMTNASGCRSQWPRDLRRRPLARCDRGFESHCGHGYLSVVCCQKSLRRADHSSRGILRIVARRCMWSRNLVNEEVIVRAGLQSQRKKHQWLVADIRWNSKEILRKIAVLFHTPQHYYLNKSVSFPSSIKKYICIRQLSW